MADNPNEIKISKDDNRIDDSHDDAIINNLDGFIETTQPFGSIEKAIGNTLYGLNHRKVKNITPKNRDMYGYVFFTRPQLKLTDENIKNYRPFYNLLTNKKSSIQNYIRNILDPRLKDCPIVDEKLAFIPILTNTVKTVSGWPDKVSPTFTSKEGVRK